MAVLLAGSLATSGVASAQAEIGAAASIEAGGPESSAGGSVSAAAVGEAPITYWVATADGGVYGVGAAPFHGSLAGTPLARPIVSMEEAANANGYWLVASDGGVFSFGDARFFGSTGGIALNQPIVGMAATPSGNGYWLVASDGGVFSFGDATFFGSTGSIRLNRPVVGISATETGGGYWLVASDGGLFAYGDAAFHGSTGSIALTRPIVGMSATPSGGGYWLVAADGGVFAFGDAPFRGSLAGQRLGASVVAMAATRSANPFTPGSTGYDISWPQCGGAYPDGAFDLAVVGVNGGASFRANPCLASEVQWAGSATLSLYMNINSPFVSQPSRGDDGPAGRCGADDSVCRGYNYGWNAGIDAVETAQAAGVWASLWWLDVEKPTSLWSDDQAANAQVVQGAVDALTSRGVLAGIYSTPYQWNLITGSYQFAGSIPLWQAGAYDPATGALRTSYCDKTFAGGQTWLIQGASTPFDTNYAC